MSDLLSLQGYNFKKPTVITGFGENIFNLGFGIYIFGSLFSCIFYILYIKLDFLF